ncbi:hypothetical protein H8E77_33260 [bacterium]|nr:hypothetical protein [bacterium]
MIPKPHLSVLRKLYAKLESEGVNWVLTGSASFALQGIPMEVHDIDVQTDKVGAYRIEELFSRYSTKKVSFSSTDNIRSHFGELYIDGVRVEIMGDIQKRLEYGNWEEPVNLEFHKRFVNVAGMRIPVLSLEYEYQAYLKLGRIEKAEKFKKGMKHLKCKGR